jgi:transposase
VLQEGQQKLESLTANTLESVSFGHQSLMDQQEKLRVTQRNIQDFVVLNLRELTREKALIAAGHREIAKMTEDVKKKLGQCDLQKQTTWSSGLSYAFRL